MEHSVREAKSNCTIILRDHFSPLRWTEIPGDRHQANNTIMPCIITNNEKFNEGEPGCYFRRNNSQAREEAEVILIRNQVQQVRKLALVPSDLLLSDNLIEPRVAKDTKFP